MHGDVAAQSSDAGQGRTGAHRGGATGAAIDHQSAARDSGGSGVCVAVGEGQFTRSCLGQGTGSCNHAGNRRAIARADVEDLRGTAGQGYGAAGQRQAVGPGHVEGQAFVQSNDVEVQCLAGQVAGEDDGLAAGDIGCSDGNGLTEAHTVAEINGRRVVGIGDVDNVAGDYDISGDGAGAVIQAVADGGVTRRRVIAVGNPLCHIIDQCSGRCRAAAGEGDGQYAAHIGEGGEGLPARLQVAAIDAEQRAGGVEAQHVAA